MGKGKTHDDVATGLVVLTRFIHIVFLIRQLAYIGQKLDDFFYNIMAFNLLNSQNFHV